MTKKGANNSYWGNIKDAVSSLYNGLAISLRHIWEAKDSRTPIGIEDDNYFNQKTGIVTLQYPNESFPVPDNGRYRLHNEIEDCIVCDKCAKICPVNCIDIEPVRAIDEDLGKTSDGTPKRIHAAKFDIDMGKCCFCGLCTTVCPTECLTMTKAYDFSEFDVADHIYEFAEMTPLEILEKKQKLELYNQEKANALAAKKLPNQEKDATTGVVKAKPTFKPKVQAPTNKQEEGEKTDASASPPSKPVFRPKVKPVAKDEDDKGNEALEIKEDKPLSTDRPKPVFKPKIKPVLKKEEDLSEREGLQEAETAGAKSPKPVFRPKVKPVIKKEEKAEASEENTTGDEEEKTPSPARPVFRPKIKPVVKKEEENQGTAANEDKGANSTSTPKPKPVFRPKIKPKKDDDSNS